MAPACPSGVVGHGAGGPERVRKPEEPLLAGDATGSSARKVPHAAIQSVMAWSPWGQDMDRPGDIGPFGYITSAGRALSEILARSQ